MLRAQGRYGPELRDVLPGFIALGLAVFGPLFTLALLYRVHGPGGLVLGAVLFAGLTYASLRGWRRIARRRSGLYTTAELARLDHQGLTLATERMLRRDGWLVTDLTEGNRTRLYGRDRHGRELDVAVRTAVEIPPGENVSGPAPLRETGRPGVDRILRLVVSPGTFSRTDVLWASRQGGVRLLDGQHLQRWAAGTPLDDLGLPT